MSTPAWRGPPHTSSHTGAHVGTAMGSGSTWRGDVVRMWGRHQATQRASRHASRHAGPPSCISMHDHALELASLRLASSRSRPSCPRLAVPVLLSAKVLFCPYPSSYLSARRGTRSLPALASGVVMHLIHPASLCIFGGKVHRQHRPICSSLPAMSACRLSCHVSVGQVH